MLSTKRRCHINRKFTVPQNTNYIANECQRPICPKNLVIPKSVVRCECDCGDDTFVVIPFSGPDVNKYDLAKLFASTGLSVYNDLMLSGDHECRCTTIEYTEEVCVKGPHQRMEKESIDCKVKVQANNNKVCYKCKDLISLIGRNGVNVMVEHVDGKCKVYLSLTT